MYAYSFRIRHGACLACQRLGGLRSGSRVKAAITSIPERSPARPTAAIIPRQEPADKPQTGERPDKHSNPLRLAPSGSDSSEGAQEHRLTLATAAAQSGDAELGLAAAQFVGERED